MKFITELQPNQVFVFGSNEQGIHGKGAAFQAMKFGAKKGIGFGHVGQTFAIPTKSTPYERLPIHVIEAYIHAFIAYAASHKELEFLVTPIGTGLASYSIKIMNDIWNSINIPNNVILIWKNY